MKQITAKQYAKIHPYLPVQRRTCGFRTSSSSMRFRTLWRTAANGARCRNGSATGPRSTPDYAAGRAAACSSGCSPRFGTRKRSARTRLRRRNPPAGPRPWDDAGRAAEGEPESRTELRPGNLQVSERDRTAIPEVQGLPAPLHAVRQARRDVSGLREPRCRCRNDA